MSIYKQCNMVVHLQLIKVMIGHNISLFEEKKNTHIIKCHHNYNP